MPGTAVVRRRIRVKQSVVRRQLSGKQQRPPSFTASVLEQIDPPRTCADEDLLPLGPMVKRSNVHYTFVRTQGRRFKALGTFSPV